jgi:hypothetical protein
MKGAEVDNQTAIKRLCTTCNEQEKNILPFSSILHTLFNNTIVFLPALDLDFSESGFLDMF